MTNSTPGPVPTQPRASSEATSSSAPAASHGRPESRRFCLSAATVDGRSWELLTVSPDFEAPGRLRLSR